MAAAGATAWGRPKQPSGSVTTIEMMLAMDRPYSPAGAPPAIEGVRPRRASASVDSVTRALTLGEDERLARLREIFASMLPALPGSSSLLAPVSTGIPSESLARFADSLARLGLE